MESEERIKLIEKSVLRAFECVNLPIENITLITTKTSYYFKECNTDTIVNAIIKGYLGNYGRTEVLDFNEISKWIKCYVKSYAKWN